MKLKGKFINNVEAKYSNNIRCIPGFAEEIVLHFLYEYPSLPEGFDLTMNEGDGEVQEKPIFADADILREVKATITMPMNIAKDLYNTLGAIIELKEEEFFEVDEFDNDEEDLN